VRYSSLDQINRENVNRLELAWSFETGDSMPGSEMQCNPIVVDNVLYLTTPKLNLVALDAATGKLRWRFDPSRGLENRQTARNRGIAWWGEGADRRLLFVVRHHLHAIDARTGQLIENFGNKGSVDLREGLGRNPEEQSVSATTPGVVYGDLLILGSIVGEDLPASPGDIRAFDVRSGKIRWTFHTVPHPGEFGCETWPKDAWTYGGAANNWCGMSVDEKRGMVFVPTGSAAFDFYGANRLGDNLFANCLLALNAKTGERIWHFQAVHHDLLDRDFPSPPSLVTVQRDGHSVDAVAQPSKQGFVYLFERATGKPLFPIEEQKTPPSDVDGEEASPTQPAPLLPPPFARSFFTESLVTTRTPAAHQAVLERFRKVRSNGRFAPPSFQGTIVFPGFDGGAEWGGAAFDPDTGLFYVNSNEMPWILRLVERDRLESKVTGKSVYMKICASCHRADLQGTPPRFPSLAGIGLKRNPGELSKTIRDGIGLMPSFSRLDTNRLDALVEFLSSGKDQEVKGAAPEADPRELKYTMDGYNKFLDPDGYPAITPPWGTLNAMDLNTGKMAWSIPFGEYPELAAKGLRDTGSENYGGPVVTAGGLVFIGATVYDHKFHAYDKSNGKLLWETNLPAGGTATPATYAVNGRQFVVIAAGGGKCRTPSGGAYQAFALPSNR
jgi:quinoprotein glucose dehydrogenase